MNLLFNVMFFMLFLELFLSKTKIKLSKYCRRKLKLNAKNRSGTINLFEKLLKQISDFFCIHDYSKNICAKVYQCSQNYNIMFNRQKLFRFLVGFWCRLFFLIHLHFKEHMCPVLSLCAKLWDNIYTYTIHVRKQYLI